MEINRKFLLLILVSIFCSCKEFKREKIEVNYKEKYIKILSNDYVIDSLVMYNSIDKYYIIGLADKEKGSSIIKFNNVNAQYVLYKDSLDYYCSKSPAINSPGLMVTIRKKVTTQTADNNVYKIQYAGYNQIPCTSNIIDTIETQSPYK